MSNEEKAQLNFLLTKLRCQIEKFVLESGTDISPFTEMKYEELIEKINEIMQLSIIEGDK
jgi:hypothetical protein